MTTKQMICETVADCIVQHRHNVLKTGALIARFFSGSLATGRLAKVCPMI